MEDVYDLIEQAMRKAKPDLDEFDRQKNKNMSRQHHKTKRDSFLVNLERIVQSFKRRRISKESAVLQLRKLIA